MVGDEDDRGLQRPSNTSRPTARLAQCRSRSSGRGRRSAAPRAPRARTGSGPRRRPSSRTGGPARRRAARSSALLRSAARCRARATRSRSSGTRSLSSGTRPLISLVRALPCSIARLIRRPPLPHVLRSARPVSPDSPHPAFGLLRRPLGRLHQRVARGVQNADQRGGRSMADNRGVAYMGAGKVEVQDIDFPGFELKDGPGRPPRQRGPQAAPRGDPEDRLDEHLRLRPAHGPRPHDRARGPDPRPRDHRRGDRDRTGRRVHQEGRPLLGAVQHRLRALPPLQGRRHRRLPEHEPGPAGLGVRLRRHGRLGRRPGRVRDRPLRRLEPAQVPRQGPGDGEDPRPDDAVGHLPDRLPRRLHGGRDVGLDGVRRGRRPGRPGRGVLGAAARRGGRDRRRPDPGAAGAGGARSAASRSTSPRATRRSRSSRSSACPRSTPRSTRSASRRAATAPTRGHEAPADGAQQHHGPDPRGRQARHPRPLRDGRPGRGATRPPRRARCRSGSASAGPSRSRSRPASAR